MSSIRSNASDAARRGANWMAPVLLVLAACADRGPSPTIVSLQYDTALANANFPNPAARLTFGGRTAWFLFDTGAGVHTLARWFVDAAGMTMDDSLADAVRATDATGEPVKFRAVRRQVGRLADGTALPLEVAIVADFPPQFEEEEVGGLINPQLLAGEGEAAALDLRVPELRLEPFDEAVSRVGGQRVAGEQVQVCRAEDSPIPNLRFAVPVTAGDAKAWMQLDTGAETSSLQSGSALVRGVKLEPGGATMGVAGRRQPYSVARNLAVSFAGHQTTLDAQVVEDSEPNGGCGPDGLLGLDALGKCALVFDRDSLAIKCES